MFGSKQEKQPRPGQYEELQSIEALTPARLVARLDVPRSTVLCDPPELDARGVNL